MRVPSRIKKCVVFLACRKHNGTLVNVGSAFFLQSRDKKGCYLVTAKHVIEGVRGKLLLEEVSIRANSKDGHAILIDTKTSEWRYHPEDASVDVAVLPMMPFPEMDHLVISTDTCITDEQMRQYEVDVGDEVFVVGLFHHHAGERRNIPVIRVGNIAALAEEKVKTDLGLMEAHLIEARSIGGLSGSPVFLNLGVVRYFGGQMRNAKKDLHHSLFGLIHGHFDENFIAADAEDAFGVSPSRVNTGIAIVAPMEKIFETIEALTPAA